MTQSIYTQTPDHYHGSIKSLLKVMWCDIPPSKVTHIWNFCSAFNPSKVHTHTAVNTHAPWTHTRSSGQPFMLRCPGSSWGFGALLKGTSSWYWRWRESTVHSFPPTYNSRRTWRWGSECTALSLPSILEWNVNDNATIASQSVYRHGNLLQSKYNEWSRLRK